MDAEISSILQASTEILLLAQPAVEDGVFGPVVPVAGARLGAAACGPSRQASLTDLKISALCELLGLKLSTVNRKLLKRSLLRPDEAERLMGLQRLIGQVEAVVRDRGDGSPFGAGRWLADWLQRPNRALGGELPASFMDTAEGREQVGRLIGAQRSGSYM